MSKDPLAGRKSFPVDWNLNSWWDPPAMSVRDTEVRVNSVNWDLSSNILEHFWHVLTLSLETSKILYNLNHDMAVSDINMFFLPQTDKQYYIRYHPIPTLTLATNWPQLVDKEWGHLTLQWCCRWSAKTWSVWSGWTVDASRCLVSGKPRDRWSLGWM